MSRMIVSLEKIFDPASKERYFVWRMFVRFDPKGLVSLSFFQKVLDLTRFFFGGGSHVKFGGCAAEA